MFQNTTTTFNWFGLDFLSIHSFCTLSHRVNTTFLGSGLWVTCTLWTLSESICDPEDPTLKSSQCQLTQIQFVFRDLAWNHICHSHIIRSASELTGRRQCDHYWILSDTSAVKAALSVLFFIRGFEPSDFCWDNETERGSAVLLVFLEILWSY